jgi:HlyD family secretion protein
MTAWNKQWWHSAPWALSIAVSLSLMACSEPAPTAWSGYAEGDYVYVAAPIGGQLDQLSVKAGDHVERGDGLFALDAQAELGAQAEAKARLAGAQAQAADTSKGRRSDEQAVTRAQLTQARAAAVLAQAAWARQQDLVRQGFVSQASADAAKAALDQARGRVTELEAGLRVGSLPARSDQRDAARALADAQAQVLRQSEWRLAQKQQHAPVTAQVADVFFRRGEYVQPGQPVLSLLPPGGIKARFYVPEDEVASLATGQWVSLGCDGCGDPVAARISHVATGPEFTPPVIYSNAQRARLVFMVEAKPRDGEGARLHPGQPLDVKRLDGEPR